MTDDEREGLALLLIGASQGEFNLAPGVLRQSAAQLRAGGERIKAMEWRGAPFPTSGRIIFAVPVYCSANTADPGAFSHWDVWADDAGDDWEDEREIGWRMSDATMWMPCPKEPGND